VKPVGLAVLGFLLPLGGVCATAATSPQEAHQNEPPAAFAPIVDNLENSTSKFPALRCASFIMALRVYRQIMRSNPVYGRNQDAGAELNWIDDVENWDEMNSKESVSFVGEYMDAFGPVTVPTKIAKMPLYVSDEGFCLKYLRKRP
jgi:hypothetical protein